MKTPQETIGAVNPRGFTMIEIMVVVAIMGILAALIIPNVVGQDDKARVTAVKSDMRALASSLDLYKLDNFSYPTTEQGLEALVNKPEGARNWPPGGYLKSIPKDPWHRDYIYVSPGNSGPYDLISLGADGVEGGEGYAADMNVNDL